MVRSLNCELREQFEIFSSASGRDIGTEIGISSRVARSDDSMILDVGSCGHTLNCKMSGHFENFSSASGSNLAGLTSVSPLVSLSEGELLDSSTSWCSWICM